MNDALRALFPSKVEGEAFTDWLWRYLTNGNGDVSPRQLILMLVLLRELSAAGDQVNNDLPLFREQILCDAMSSLSAHSFSETISDFRVATGLLRNCRAAKLEVFRLADVEQLFDKTEGSTALQIELLERLGVLERIVTEDQAGTRVPQFRIPRLYTRGWSVAS